MMNAKINPVILEFVQETNERMQRVGTNLVLIENGSAGREIVDELYRDMHTIKGSAQLFGFYQIGQIAHAMETCLDPIRRHELALGAELVDAISNCLNVLEDILKWITEKSVEPDAKEKLISLIPKLVEVAMGNFGHSSLVNKDLHIGHTDHEVRSVAPSAPPHPPKMPPQQKPSEIKMTATKIEKDGRDMSATQTAATNQVEKPTLGDHSTTLRVHVGILDRLMNLIGEMVLVRNQVLQFSNVIDDISFLQMSQRLNLVTSELQGEVMKTRMQPIGNVLEPFQRVVRDLARDLNKKIQLILEGKETELDKTLLESIKDPLTHIIRNSADHGIETPEARVAAGKSEQGTILVRSYHEGGQVIIEVKDDGKGLNREKILSKAIEKGLIKPERANQMSERDIYNIIFLPGFSTTENVTTVSGRGVGMDVVKTNVEKIGGSAEVVSTFGQGTLIRLKIPLTLAIIPALLVKCENERFAIPQVKLVELVRVEKDNDNAKIEYLQGRPMYRLRNELLPLIDLKAVLKLSDKTKNYENRDVVSIVVLNADGRQFGLIVDEIQDTADIVVKPLSPFLKKLSVYSGATIMGDGSVSIILDVSGIIQWESLSGTQGKEKEERVKQAVSSVKDKSESQELLLFKINAPGKYCIPLSLVQRLEEFNQKHIEYTGAQPVVRYRDTILPIISLNKVLGYGTEKDFAKEKISIIVIHKQGRPYGILVDEIIDVEATSSDVNTNIKDREGILGNMIIHDEVTVVLDILNIIQECARKMGVQVREEKEVGGTLKSQRANFPILLAEDANFFKRHIKDFLEAAGYRVTVTSDGAEAYDVAVNGKFAALVSDIEMPKMTGYELVMKLRTQEAWKSKPIVAVTTRFNERDIQMGKESGFDYYLEKFNGDILVSRLDELLKIGGR